MVEVHNLFPRPVVSIAMDTMKKEEKDYIHSLENELRKNIGNFTTIECYLLNNQVLSRLKQSIVRHVDEYFENILCVNDNVTPYITQSWANFTYKDGYHHPHKHTNSIVSGVYYVKCVENDRINFIDDRHDSIEIQAKSYNLYNSNSWWLPAMEDYLLLFPSSLRHSVPNVTTDDVRISISFNVFVKGKLGSDETLTALEI